MAKEMTFKEFIEFANANYEKGGDTYVECWDQYTFDWFTKECGKITKQRAKRMFKENYSEEKEQMAIRRAIENGEW